MPLQILKCGSLYRRSSVLRKWKQKWFVLYADGSIKYFESQDSHSAEESNLMPAKCTSIEKGTESIFAFNQQAWPHLLIKCKNALKSNKYKNLSKNSLNVFYAIKGVTPPPGLDVNLLIVVKFLDGCWTLCAANMEDLQSWVTALERSRILQYSGYGDGQDLSSGMAQQSFGGLPAYEMPEPPPYKS